MEGQLSSPEITQVTSLEKTASVERPDARVYKMHELVRNSVLHASDTSSVQMQHISEQYQNAAAFVSHIDQPGRANELLVALHGIAEAAGISDFAITVETPENTHPATEARMVSEAAVRAYHELPSKIAERKIQSYMELQLEETARYQALEALTKKDPLQISRGEVRKAGWDRREAGYAMLDEEVRLLDTIGATMDVKAQMRSARREAFSGRVTTDYVLTQLDQRKAQAQEERIEAARNELAVRNYIIDSTKRPDSQTDIFPVSPLVFESFGRKTSRIDLALRQANIHLMPIVNKIKEGRDGVQEKIMQTRNAIKSAVDVAARELVENTARDLLESADDWRASRARASSEREQSSLEKTRAYYDKRHSLAVEKQMKTELALVKQQGREHGLSAARVESMIEERRQQFSELKNPNESIIYFQDQLRSHVQVIRQIEHSVNLEFPPVGPDDATFIPVIFDTDTKPIQPVFTPEYYTPITNVKVPSTPLGFVSNSSPSLEQMVHSNSETQGSHATAFEGIKDQLMNARSSERLYGVLHERWENMNTLHNRLENPPKDLKKRKKLEESYLSFMKRGKGLVSEIDKERTDNPNFFEDPLLEKYYLSYKATLYLLGEHDNSMGRETALEPAQFKKLYNEQLEKSTQIAAQLNDAFAKKD